MTLEELERLKAEFKAARLAWERVARLDPKNSSCQKQRINGKQKLHLEIVARCEPLAETMFDCLIAYETACYDLEIQPFTHIRWVRPPIKIF